jgi:hypothetical protein
MERYKEEIGRVHPTEQVPSLVVSNKKLKDPKSMSSTFNNFFITASEKLKVRNLRNEVPFYF